MIVFKRLFLEGFGRFVNQQIVDLNSPGINIIKGKNGTGKSTIFNGVYWVLYGKDMNGRIQAKIPTWEWMRTDDWRGTRSCVELVHDDTMYTITRHWKFKGSTKGIIGEDSLMIFKGEGSRSPMSFISKAESQKFIDSMLGMDHEIFMNTVLFGQRMTRLINASNKEKRELFEVIFELAFIDDAKAKGKLKLDSLNIKVYQLDTDKESLTKEVELLESSIQDKKLVLENFATEKKGRVDEINEDINTEENARLQTKNLVLNLKKELEKFPEGSYLELQDRFTKVNTEFANYEIELSKVVDSIEKCGIEIKSSEQRTSELNHKLENVDATCDRCEQDLPKSKVELVKKGIRIDIKDEKGVIPAVKQREKELKVDERRFKKMADELKSGLDLLKDDMKIAKVSSEKITEIKTKITLGEQKYEEFQGDIDRLKVRLKTEKEKKLPKIDLPGLEKKKQKCLTDIEEADLSLDGYNKEKENIDWWVSTAFSSSGLKSYVFNTMLTRLNKNIVQYASKLGVGVQFSVDLTKSQKPFVTHIYQDKEKIDYEDLSGGQKQRIDICLAFAMHDLVSANNDTNLLLMDEIMEGIDDEGGTEDVFDLIRFKAGTGRAVYLITHLSNIDTHRASIMRVENDGETSYIKK